MPDQTPQTAHALDTINNPPALCEHGVWQYGGCKNADCPNAAENVIPPLPPIPRIQVSCAVLHLDAGGNVVPCPDAGLEG